jgi:1-acyl-sn-glycerol-3-phosphate acyltransferase
MRRIAGMLGEWLYAAWWWVVIAVCYLLAWFAVMALPRPASRWSAVRAIARCALLALGTPVSLSGVERIPKNNAMLVFNHSSYMDVVVLAATLPGEPAFVAKKELAAQVFAGPFTRRLGTHFVERRKFGEGVADANALIAAARQGRNIIFFPEGTFTRRAALSEFYLGAFKVAAEAGMPILPGILRGTRSMLRGEQCFPRRVPLSVEIEEPVKPASADFASVVALRHKVRQVILAKCGEPDLDELVKIS